MHRLMLSAWCLWLAGCSEEARCGRGDAKTCLILGIRCTNGEGQARDAARAADFFRQACDGGELVGCVNLGELLENGDGTAKDPARAAVLFKKACDGSIGGLVKSATARVASTLAAGWMQAGASRKRGTRDGALEARLRSELGPSLQ